jgi:hypothetical protein
MQRDALWNGLHILNLVLLIALWWSEREAFTNGMKAGRNEMLAQMERNMSFRCKGVTLDPKKAY